MARVHTKTFNQNLNPPTAIFLGLGLEVTFILARFIHLGHVLFIYFVTGLLGFENNKESQCHLQLLRRIRPFLTVDAYL